MHLFGPPIPLPHNYKAALDFYQNNLIDYLEWYTHYNNGISQKLDTLIYDWRRKEELDKKLETFNPQEKKLIQNAEIRSYRKKKFWEKFKGWWN